MSTAWLLVGSLVSVLKVVSRETSAHLFHVKPYQACLLAYDCASLIQGLQACSFLPHLM